MDSDRLGSMEKYISIIGLNLYPCSLWDEEIWNKDDPTFDLVTLMMAHRASPQSSEWLWNKKVPWRQIHTLWLRYDLWHPGPIMAMGHTVLVRKGMWLKEYCRHDTWLGKTWHLGMFHNMFRPFSCGPDLSLPYLLFHKISADLSQLRSTHKYTLVYGGCKRQTLIETVRRREGNWQRIQWCVTKRAIHTLLASRLP
jgi:hypothetical protein